MMKNEKTYKSFDSFIHDFSESRYAEKKIHRLY